MTHAEYEREPALTVKWMTEIHSLYRRNGIDPVGGIHVG